MRIYVQHCLCALMVLLLLACVSLAQDAQSGDSSLADVARKARAEKSKETKPVKVFTNDDLPGMGKKDEANPPAASHATDKGKEKAATERGTEINENKAESSSEKDEAKPAPEGEEAHNEKYYGKRMAELSAALETHKRELDVLQQKLNLAQPVYYNDPQKELREEYSRSDITKLAQEVDAKKQRIADDEKAIDDLRDQLRHDGGDPGWLR